MGWASATFQLDSTKKRNQNQNGKERIILKNKQNKTKIVNIGNGG